MVFQDVGQGADLAGSLIALILAALLNGAGSCANAASVGANTVKSPVEEYACQVGFNKRGHERGKSWIGDGNIGNGLGVATAHHR